MRCPRPRRRHPGTTAVPCAGARTSGRRRALLFAAAVLVALLPGSPSAGASGPRVVVLGFDGLDYELTKQLMDDGLLPNLARLAREGSFAPLGTSIPPQSPVAWSNFITGMDGGGHGIFDFIHRDPKTLIPYLSTSRSHGSDRFFRFPGWFPEGLRKWQLPLASGRVELLRHGKAFWEVLEENGVESWILRMPANYPPSGTATRELSGMGTPDVTGTYGTFSFYTTDPSPFRGKKVTGGKIYDVHVDGGVVEAALHGPNNPLLRESEKVTSPFTVHLDPQEPFVKIIAGGEERILGEGEWTDWVPVEFDLGCPIPGTPRSIRGITRFYLKQVRPEFMLYATPVNFDPLDPAQPISTPPSFAAELARACGRFYTQGMPEDTKALSEGIFDTSEFLAQARITGDEILDEFDWVLERFDRSGGGFLFYYVGNQDQIGHMIWRSMDPDHPAYRGMEDAQFDDVIPEVCARLDGLVGRALDRLDDRTLLVIMSDHGFASWRRAMHLNSWLRDRGYLAVKNPNPANDPGLFLNVDWTRTRAYGLGLNGLYVNLRGREKYGIVDPADRDALVAEISRELLQTIDPGTGMRAVTRVYLAEEAYRDRGHLEIGPDLVVGYAEGMRCSNQSALGEVPREIFIDNTGEWSGDHCMDHEAVPGVLITSRRLKRPVPALENLAAALLVEFGIEGFAGEVTEDLESLGYVSSQE